jgi:hypothetical protein
MIDAPPASSKNTLPGCGPVTESALVMEKA